MLFKKNEFPTILIVSSLKRRRGLPKVSKCTVSSADCCRDVVMQEYGGPAGKRAFSSEEGRPSHTLWRSSCPALSGKSPIRIIVTASSPEDSSSLAKCPTNGAARLTVTGEGPWRWFWGTLDRALLPPQVHLAAQVKCTQLLSLCSRGVLLQEADVCFWFSGKSTVAQKTWSVRLERLQR